MPFGERARADHGGPHDDDLVVMGEREDCPDGATCLPPDSIARYLHLKEVDVTPTQSVTVGQLIGTVNDTGASRGAHLHYDLEVNGAPTNPADEYDC